MKWTKMGLIFKPQGDIDWMVSHAAVPVAENMGGDRFRIYCASRDNYNRAHVAYIEIDINKPKEILDISRKPALAPGELGTFDDSGAMVSWIMDHDGKTYLYYAGWSLGVTVPFYFYLGLAISEDGGESFHKVSASPILGRNRVDPYLTGPACVLIEDGAWKMWYVSGSKWEMQGNRPKHYYHIKYAESTDGIHWDRQGVVCIDYGSSDEYAIARPCVIKDDGLYRMWYCQRGESYRIGYAESRDGIQWVRKDEEVGMDVSESGWDSEMNEYPFVFDHRGERYMLYNGNGYGKTGMGLAVLEDRG